MISFCASWLFLAYYYYYYVYICVSFLLCASTILFRKFISIIAHTVPSHSSESPFCSFSRWLLLYTLCSSFCGFLVQSSRSRIGALLCKIYRRRRGAEGMQQVTAVLLGKCRDCPVRRNMVENFPVFIEKRAVLKVIIFGSEIVGEGCEKIGVCLVDRGNSVAKDLGNNI